MFVLQHIGVLGDHTDRAAKAVAVERRLDLDLAMEYRPVRAPGHQVNHLAVIMEHAVR